MGQNSDFSQSIIKEQKSHEEDLMSNQRFLTCILGIPDEYDEDPLEGEEQINYYKNQDEENTSYLQMYVNEYYDERQQQQSSAAQSSWQQKPFIDDCLNEYEMAGNKYQATYDKRRQQQQQSIGSVSGNSFQNLQSTVGMRYNINTEEIIIEEDCETQQSHQESPSNTIYESPLNLNSNYKKIIVKDNKHLKNKLKTLSKSGSTSRSRERKPNLFSQKRSSLDHSMEKFKLKAEMFLNKSLFAEKRKSLQENKSKLPKGVAQLMSTQQITPSITPSTGFQTAFSNYQSSQCSRIDMYNQKNKIKFNFTQDLSQQLKNQHQVLTSLKSQMRIKNNKKIKNAKSFQQIQQANSTSYLSQVIKENKKRDKDASKSPIKQRKNSHSVKKLKQPDIALDKGVIRVASYFNKPKCSLQEAQIRLKVDLTETQFNIISPSLSRESTPQKNKENYNLILTDSAFKKYKQNAQVVSQNQALTRLNVNLSTSNNDLSQSGQQIQNSEEIKGKNLPTSLYYKLDQKNKINKSIRSPKYNQISLDYTKKSSVYIQKYQDKSDINISQNQSKSSFFNKKRHSLNISQHNGERQNLDQQNISKRRFTYETSTILNQTQKINSLAKKLLSNHKKILL